MFLRTWGKSKLNECLSATFEKSSNPEIINIEKAARIDFLFWACDFPLQFMPKLANALFDFGSLCSSWVMRIKQLFAEQ